MQQLNFTVISNQFMVTAKEHSPCIWNMLYDLCEIRTKVTKLNQIRDRERLSENYTVQQFFSLPYYSLSTRHIISRYQGISDDVVVKMY